MLNNRSESLNEIFSALAKAQAEIDVAGENSTNPHFKSKFASLVDIVRASRPALTKHGLSVFNQIITDAQGDNYMCCLLGHSSGQWIETRIKMQPSPDIQKFGAAITYLRRYMYSAIVGVVSSEGDDDGESLVRSNGATHTPKVTELVTREQLEQLEYELAGHQDIVDSILKRFIPKINSLKDIPKESFQSVYSTVRKLVETKKSMGK